MNKLLTAFVLSFVIMPFTCISTGCEKTVSDKKTEVKQTDGSTVQKEDKVTKDDNGTVTKTHEESVDKK